MDFVFGLFQVSCGELFTTKDKKHGIGRKPLTPRRSRRTRRSDSEDWNIRTQGIDSRQGAKRAKFGGKR